MKIGIDLGGSHISVGVINEKYVIIKKYEKDFSEEDRKNITLVIEDFISSKILEIANDYSIEQIGIAAPGSVKNNIILKMVNLEIENYDIVEAIKNKICGKIDNNIKFKVRNDAKCAGLAEYNRMLISSEIQSDASMLFLGIGTGIGGAFIYNGTLFTGNMYEGCEFGHMVIKENGVQCKCGKKGCFERYGSILEFKNRVKQRLNIDNNVNGELLRDIMNSHLSEFEDLRSEYVQDLSIGISNLVNIFEPDVVVIGGGFTHFDYLFMNELESNLVNSSLLFNKRNHIDLRVAKLGNDAGMVGSVIF